MPLYLRVAWRAATMDELQTAGFAVIPSLPLPHAALVHLHRRRLTAVASTALLTVMGATHEVDAAVDWAAIAAVVDPAILADCGPASLVTAAVGIVVPPAKPERHGTTHMETGTQGLGGPCNPSCPITTAMSL